MNSQLSTESGPTSAPRGLMSRFIGVLVSPRDTFEAVAAHPHWLGMLALTAGTVALLVGGFLMTTVGQNAWLDQVEAQRAAWGRPMTDEELQGMERFMPFIGYMGFAQFLVGVPLIALLLSGIVFGIFSAALSGSATFKQVFAVAVHAGAVGVVQQLFTVPLNYFRESLSSPTNLSVFVPMLPEGSFVTRLLGTIDIFLVWWTIVLAIGVATLYRRRTTPILWSFLAVYGVIALTIAAIMSRSGGEG